MHEVKLTRWERALELPLTLSTVAFLAAYAWPILQPDMAAGWRVACSVTVWATWALLVVDFAVRFVASEDRWRFLRRNPLDLMVVVLPLLRPLRLLRLVTLLTALNRYAGNSLRGRVGIYVVGAMSLLIFVASLAVLDAERGGEGSIQSFGDAVWWAMTTVTTVGYGDMFPVTTTGRCIAVALMLAGIAVLGVVTASIASWFVERVSETTSAERAQLELLIAEVAELRRAIGSNSDVAHGANEKGDRFPFGDRSPADI